MTISWAAAVTKDDSMQFLKRVFDILPADELLQVPNLVSKAKRRRKNQHLIPCKRVPVPDESVPVPEGPVPSVSVPEEPMPARGRNGWCRNT